MSRQKQVVKDFLKRYRMDYENIDMEENCKTFIEERA